MMTNTSYKILRPVVLASALLVSAPFFVILDNTLYGKGTMIATSAVTVKANVANTTVIHKT